MIRRPAAGVTLLLLGITMIIAGFSAGESIQVLHKAVRVCLECIGIG
ncbi:MAG: thioredoxin [Firmicutes bacterium]|nr:thioredoxin [Bacillota bacterium]